MENSSESPYARLAELLARKREGKLSFDEVRELFSLHDRASADLSLAQERALPEAGALQLLVMDSFNVLYGESPKPRQRLASALFHLLLEAPSVVRKFRTYILAVSLVLLLSALGGAFAVVTSDPIAPIAVLGEGIVNSFDKALEREGDWALAASIPKEMRPPASAFIMLNNVRLTIYAFVIGIFLGYFTLGINFVNGYMLGYVSALYIEAGIRTGNPEFIYYFLAGVLPHGVLEVPAIVLGSAGGVAIGMSWLMPGRLSRLESLQRTARELLPLLLVAVILLIVAALIEAFITPLGSEVVTQHAFSTYAERLPIYVTKIVFSIAVAFLLILWLSSGAKRKAT